MNLEALWEAVKEPLREIILAILPFLVIYFSEVHAWWGVLLYVILRGGDQYLHELWKVNKKKGIRGLSPF